MQSANTPPMAALDSLRTVEFRQTLRGYHIDDVDEYLERVAVEAEALQEQLRQSAERMRQATERITQLEQQLQQLQQRPAAQQAPAPGSGGATEDTLQRTLLLAQKFVDQTHAEAEAQARTMLEEAQQRARGTVAEAEERARSIVEEAEHKLREDVARLETLRAKLAADVETISRYLDGERARLRNALGEMLHWIDENVQPSADLGTSAPAAERQVPEPVPSRTGGGDVGPGAEPRQGLMTLGQNQNVSNGTPR
jgi:DivIVA domain-containing protein